MSAARAEALLDADLDRREPASAASRYAVCQRCSPAEPGFSAPSKATGRRFALNIESLFERAEP